MANDLDKADTFVCDHPGCNAEFSQESALKRHKASKHGIDAVWIECDYPGCPYKTTRLDHLTQHLESAHSDERPFACDHPGCEAGPFKRLDHLKAHQASAHGIGAVWHKCDYPGCEYVNTQASALTQHKKNKHSDERPFACDFPGCEDAFKQASDLKRHKASKHGIGAVWHTCGHPNCGYKSLRASLLRNHMRRHQQVEEGR